MPRRKKKNRHVHSTPSREQILKDRCASYGWIMPFALKNWQDNFISQSSYMREFERWFAKKCKAGGAYVNVQVEIEDPYEIYHNSELEQNKAWKDYWESDVSWGNGEEWDTPLIQGKRSYYTKWSKALPMDHKIEAPSGEVGASLVCH